MINMRRNASALLGCLSLAVFSLDADITHATDPHDTLEKRIESAFSTWSLSVDALYMRRDGADTIPLVVGPGFVPLLNADQLEGNYDLGYEVSIAAGGSSTGWIEAAFLMLNHDEAANVATAGAQMFVYGASFGTNPLALSLDSDLYNGEINYLQDLGLGNLQGLIGVRWVSLDENLIVNDAASPPSLMLVEQENEMLGIQIGVQGVLFEHQGWEVDVAAKYGVFNNDSRTFAAFPQAGAAAVFNAGGENTSRIADVEIGLRYDFSESFSIHGGYRAIWIDNVALLTDQLDDLFVPLLGLQDVGSVFYDGFTFGAVMRF